ncbi:MAG: NAD(P)H-hydrate dehydratase [Candidatus Thermoplasmatota archaeon]
MLSFEEVAVIDENSGYRGVPPEDLMENAGEGLAEEIMKRYSERPVIFFCGTGNNGGDAYVAARYLAEEWRSEEITVYLIKGEENVRSDIARKNLDKLDPTIMVEKELDQLQIKEKSIFVDALLGTGIKGEIREPYRKVIKKMNESSNSVISVDVPSGLGADLAVKSDLTVTFHDVKEGMSQKNCAEIVVKDIVIPEKAVDHTGPGEMLLYPRPEKDSHKGDNGELLIVGGGPYTGAPVLAARAAYRTGADLVHLVVPSSIYDIVAGYSPSFIVHPVQGEKLNTSHVDEVLKLSEECDSMIIGPGLGAEERTLKAVEEIIKKVEIPLLIDADALKAFKQGAVDPNDDIILTPHRGEFEMLITGEEDMSLKEKADRFALNNQVTLLVKGEEDYITDGEDYRWNDFGNEGMTVGGTGDTLSGVVGALMSKGLGSFKAGRLGAYLACSAGDEAFKEYSWGLLPQNMIDKIPLILNERKTS